MTARRLAVFGMVIVLAILVGVFLRREVMEREAEAPPPPAAMSPAPQPETPPATSAPAPLAEAPAPETPKEAPAKVQPEAQPAEATPAAPSGTRPSFDVVRVEPNGSAVIAGRTVPGGEVQLLSNGTVIGRTIANEQGEFVLMPPPLQPGNHELTLKTSDSASTQAVTVSVPQTGQSEVLVVVGEPGKPSQVVQAGAPSGPSAGTVPDVPGATPQIANPQQPLRVGAVEAAGGRLFVQGTGPSGSKAIIYLNDTPLSEAQIGADGRWSLTIEKGLTTGDYTIRVDQVDPAGKVIARAEVPFTSDMPSELAAAPSSPAAPAAPVPSTSSPAMPQAPSPSSVPSASAPSAPAAPAPAATPETAPGTPSAPAATASAPQPAASPADQAANPVVRELGTVTVKRGDSLWRISRRAYGEGVRFSTIYDANTDQIRDPDRIYPGQVFVMPGK